MGLVLSRKVGETIIIDEKVTVEIAKTSGGKVSVNITAPPEISIRRGEIPPVDRNTCGCGDCDYCREVAPQTDQAAEQEPTATA